MARWKMRLSMALYTYFNQGKKGMLVFKVEEYFHTRAQDLRSLSRLSHGERIAGQRIARAQ